MDHGFHLACSWCVDGMDYLPKAPNNLVQVTCAILESFEIFKV